MAPGSQPSGSVPCYCYMNGDPAPELVFEQTGNRRVVHHTAYLQHLLSEAGS